MVSGDDIVTVKRTLVPSATKRILSLSTFDDSEQESDDELARETPLSFASPASTLIFLDFDDTLFPSTELFETWGLPSKPEVWPSTVLSKQQEFALTRWAASLATYLRAVCAQSRGVVVVSHSSPGWIQSCMHQFAPHIEGLFVGNPLVRVVYSKQVVQSRWRARPISRREDSPHRDEVAAQLTASKHAVMWREAKDFYGKANRWCNILSVGDMPYEAGALSDLAFRRQGPPGEVLRTKVQICQRNPTIGELTSRLFEDAALLRLVLEHDGDLVLDSSADEIVAELHRKLSQGVDSEYIAAPRGHPKAW